MRMTFILVYTVIIYKIEVSLEISILKYLSINLLSIKQIPI